jgi:hypothetical protein
MKQQLTPECTVLPFEDLEQIEECPVLQPRIHLTADKKIFFILIEEHSKFKLMLVVAVGIKD